MAIDQASHRNGGLQHRQRGARAVCGTRAGPIARLRAAALIPRLVFALIGLIFAGAARVEAHAGHQHPGTRLEQAAALQPSHATRQASSTVEDRGTPAGAAAGAAATVDPDGVQPGATLANAAIAFVMSASAIAAESKTPVDDALAMFAERTEQSVAAWLLLADSPATASAAIEQPTAGSVADFPFDVLPAVAVFSGGQAGNPLNHLCGAMCGACASCTSSSCCSGMLTPVAIPAVSCAGENTMRFTRAEAMQGGTVDPMPRPPNSASLI